MDPSKNIPTQPSNRLVEDLKKGSLPSRSFALLSAAVLSLSSCGERLEDVEEKAAEKATESLPAFPERTAEVVHVELALQASEKSLGRFEKRFGDATPPLAALPDFQGIQDPWASYKYSPEAIELYTEFRDALKRVQRSAERCAASHPEYKENLQPLYQSAEAILQLDPSGNANSGRKERDAFLAQAEIVQKRIIEDFGER